MEPPKRISIARTVMAGNFIISSRLCWLKVRDGSADAAYRFARSLICFASFSMSCVRFRTVRLMVGGVRIGVVYFTLQFRGEPVETLYVQAQFKLVVRLSR